MDFWEVVTSRYSLRDFAAGRDVSDQDLEKILQAAVRAPSAGNMQAWFFAVVRNHDKKKALAVAALDQEFVAQAPVAVVVLADPRRSAARYGERGAKFYCLLDAAAACENLLLAATALGLGGCWVGAFDDEKVIQILGLPHLRPIAIIPLGHPAGPPEEKSSRRPLEKVSKLIP